SGRRRHTRWPRDWSSDVCSSDLLLPLPWTSATPSGYVTEDAFERIAAMFVEDLRAALPVDGIFLSLHGAMVTEHCEDPEGELLRSEERRVGKEVRCRMLCNHQKL